MRNLKRPLSLCVVLAALLALGVTTSAAEFSDVPAGAEYAEAVRWAADSGYVNGYQDGRFGVSDPVTRAQLSAILYRSAGSPAASGVTHFSDVAETAYYASAAGWAADSGLINGYQDGRFGVSDPVTRQQVAAILWRWAGSPAAGAEDYPDESGIASYAQTAVDWSRANSVIAAREDGSFAPGERATRAEIVMALYQYRKLSGVSETPSGPDAAGPRILVAYFSATGSTKAAAGYIAEALGGATYEITPAQPYTSADLDWTDSSSRVNDEHNDPSSRPAIAGDGPELEGYDVVFLGYPIWWGEAPNIVRTFLEANSLNGKTVVPFCTSSSSGLGSSGTNLHSLASGANWLEGRRFSSGVSQAEVKEWAESLEF